VLGARWIWDHVQRHDWRNVIPGAFAAACICAFSFFGVSTFIGLRPGNFVHNYALLAELYEDKGDFKSAEALLHEGLQRQPKAESLLCVIGSLYLRINNPEQALIYIHQCLQVNELYPDAWFMLGVANEKLGRMDEAKRCFQRQVEIIPDHQPAKKHLERVMFLPGETGR
jgi:tetratricopeptide (TPR) repeat protein